MKTKTMTRNENIKEAYKDYMGNGGMLQPNLWFAFKAGAEWAYISDLLPKGGEK